MNEQTQFKISSFLNRGVSTSKGIMIILLAAFTAVGVILIYQQSL